MWRSYNITRLSIADCKLWLSTTRRLGLATSHPIGVFPPIRLGPVSTGLFLCVSAHMSRRAKEQAARPPSTCPGRAAARHAGGLSTTTASGAAAQTRDPGWVQRGTTGIPHLRCIACAEYVDAFRRVSRCTACGTRGEHLAASGKKKSRAKPCSTNTTLSPAFCFWLPAGTSRRLKGSPSHDLDRAAKPGRCFPHLASPEVTQP